MLGSLVFSMFAALGLALATFGLFAVFGAAAAARSRELGLRLALGAPRSHLIRIALQRGALTLGVGFVAGTLFGVLILGIIQTLIAFDGSLSSWWTRIVIGALLLVFCLLQRAFEARRR